MKQIASYIIEKLILNKDSHIDNSDIDKVYDLMKEIFDEMKIPYTITKDKYIFTGVDYVYVELSKRLTENEMKRICGEINKELRYNKFPHRCYMGTNYNDNKKRVSHFTINA